MIRTVKLGVARVVVTGALVLVSSGCGLIGGSPVPAATAPAASPTLLPPPKPMSSPEPGPAGSPVALSSPTAAVPPTPVPPPDLNAKPQASKPSSAARAKVVNTDGQGANMRAEPSPGGQLVRTVKEGTELELIGDEREAAGRTWRNVRDPGDGASGWIVSELLSPLDPAAPPGASQPTGAPAGGATAPAASPSPAAKPKPTGSPPPAPAPVGAAKPTQRIGEADRAYLSELQAPMDALGKAISTANEQIERAGGKPDIASDPAWSKDTQAVVQSMRDASAKIRAAQPGPSTAGVHRYASNAADRADEAADGLRVALDTGDTRGLLNVRTILVRMLAEINNMNLTLLELQ